MRYSVLFHSAVPVEPSLTFACSRTAQSGPLLQLAPTQYHSGMPPLAAIPRRYYM